jgi:asparagine synthase (glutamine-hydrolysing)
MCDISGFTGSEIIPLEQYGAVNAHRGPDGTNYFYSPDFNVAHSLLAISPNKYNIQQPYEDPRTGNVLAYNGEIYGLGDKFDTIHLSDMLNDGKWRELSNNTNGMWAFVYFDRNKQTVTMCRDHFGVKPLYYSILSEQLYFASTPKPLIMAQNTLGYGVEINQWRLRQFQANDRFPIGEGHPLRGIHRVPPGGIVKFDLITRKIIEKNSLWQGFHVSPNYRWTKQEVHDKVEKAVKDVCTAPGIKKTISLSGGLDSTLIASVAKKHDIEISATTMRFRKQKSTKKVPVNERMYSEFDIAKKTCEEKDIPFNWSYYKEDKEATFAALSTPMWDINRTGPRYANIKKAASQGNKIYIVGDGADELITGYSGDAKYVDDPHKFGLSAKKMQRLSDNANRKKWNDGSVVCFAEFIHIFPNWKTHLGDDAINNHRLYRALVHCDGFNTTADHLAGSFGMESRVPFLHQELAKYLLNIPAGVKLQTPGNETLQAEGFVDNNNTYQGAYKYLLRDLCREFLPDHVRTRGRKIGFANPVNARDHELNKEIGAEEIKGYYRDAKNWSFDVDLD